MGSINAFPVQTLKTTELAASLLSPAAGDLFAGVQVANATQSPAGSLVRYTWQQLLTKPAVTGTLTVNGGTVVSADSLISAMATWNNGAAIFAGLNIGITDTASAATSSPIAVFVNAAPMFSVDKTGKITNAGDLAVGGNSTLTGGALNVASGATIQASVQLIAATANQTAGGLSVTDTTTSAFAGFGPKSLGVKGYVGADKAGVQVTGSADGDMFLKSIAGSVWLGSGANGALKVDTSNDINAMLGNVKIQSAGKGLQVKTGSNARVGTVTLSAGNGTITNSSFTANTVLFFGNGTQSGSNFGTYYYTMGAGSASVHGNATDASTLTWLAVEIIP